MFCTRVSNLFLKNKPLVADIVLQIGLDEHSAVTESVPVFHSIHSFQLILTNLTVPYFAYSSYCQRAKGFGRFLM